VSLGGCDRTHIDVDNLEQVKDCAEHFGISEDKVKEAVRAVGPEILAVEAWLSDHAKF
jgi:hypothetical protein